MLIEDLIKVPDAAIVNNIVPKQDIFEATGMTKSDKDYFVRYVKQIRWLYKFDDASVRIKPYETEEKSYLEAELISIKLKKEFQEYNHNTGNFHRFDARLDRIVDILLRFIPYPILLCAEFNDEIKFYVSHISESKSDYDKITLDELIYTDWIDVNNLDGFDKELIDKLQIDNLDKTNVFTFYDDMVTAIIQYNGSKEAGKNVNLSAEEIQEIMDKIHKFEREIADLKVKIRREDSFNKQMEYNIEINKLKMEIKILQEELKNE